MKIFFKVGIAYCLDAPGIENFDENALSPTVKETEEILCFANFDKNWKIQNGLHFFFNFLKSGYSILLRYPGGRKF